MKPYFEISKNWLITAFICGILVGVTVSFVMIKRIPENDQKASKTENSGVGYMIRGVPGITFYDLDSGLIESIMAIESENELLTKQNSQLKKKVDYYFEFYRKNQPVGMTIAADEDTSIITGNTLK